MFGWSAETLLLLLFWVFALLLTQADSQLHRQTDRQADSQLHRQTDRLTDRL